MTWQFILLAIASLTLSIASGWTTWQGITNFTENSLLSMLITIGIQGIMLTAAWLIGESFVRERQSRRRRGVQNRNQVVADRATFRYVKSLWPYMALVAIIALFSAPSFVVFGVHSNAVLIALAIVTSITLTNRYLSAFGGEDLGQSMRVNSSAVLRNIPLWSLFLCCAAASVFFSFDALFSTIYDKDHREKSSQTRAQTHVSQLVAALKSELETKKNDRVESYFGSAQWKDYEHYLRQVQSHALTRQSHVKLSHEKFLKRQEEQASSAAKGVARASASVKLAQFRRSHYEKKLSAITANIAETNKRYVERKRELQEAGDQLQDTKAKATAEAAGLGVTGKAGRGPKFMEIKRAELKQALVHSKLTARVDALAKQLASLEKKKLQGLAEVADIAGALNRAEVNKRAAEKKLQRLSGNLDQTSQKRGALDAKITDLVNSKIRFVDTPNRKNFSHVLHACEGVMGASNYDGGEKLLKTEASCAKRANGNALESLFALNEAVAKFNQECASQGAMSKKTTSDILDFGRRCLQLSGLESSPHFQTWHTDLRLATLYRDDQAHRLIVSWNALFDQNPLAYLGLFIALSIDGLVFMSGLFGANVQSRVQIRKTIGQNNAQADQWKAVVYAALLPELEKRCKVVLEAVNFDLSRTNPSAPVIDLSALGNAKKEIVGPFIAAAQSVGMAQSTNSKDCYEISHACIAWLRHQLTEKSPGPAPEPSSNANFKGLIEVSLNERAAAREMLQKLLITAEPVSNLQSFTHEIAIDDLPQQNCGSLVAILNAGVSCGLAAPDEHAAGRYLLRPGFFSTLCNAVETLREDKQTYELPEQSRPSDRQENTLHVGTNGVADEPQRQTEPETNTVLPETTLFASNDTTETSERKPPQDLKKRSLSSELVILPHKLSKKRRKQAGPVKNATKQPLTVTNPANVSTVSHANLQKLSRLIGVSAFDLAQLPDPIVASRLKSAHASLIELCDFDLLLSRRIREGKDHFNAKLQQFCESNNGFYLAGSSVRHDTEQNAEARFIETHFDHIFLAAEGLKEIRDWYGELLTKQELAVTLEDWSATGIQKLVKSGAHAPVFMAVDSQHQTDWEAIIFRIEGLKQAGSETVTFSELIP